MSIHNAVLAAWSLSGSSFAVSSSPSSCSHLVAYILNVKDPPKYHCKRPKWHWPLDARSLITSPFQFKKRQKKAEPPLIIYLASCLSTPVEPVIQRGSCSTVYARRSYISERHARKAVLQGDVATAARLPPALQLSYSTTAQAYPEPASVVFKGALSGAIFLI